MSYPSKDEILSILSEIEANEKSGEAVYYKGLPVDASPIDKMKYNICQNILKYKHSKKFSNVALGKLLSINPSAVSRIIHCHIDKFKLDILLQYYQVVLISMNDPKLMKSYEKKMESFFKDDFKAS